MLVIALLYVAFLLISCLQVSVHQCPARVICLQLACMRNLCQMEGKAMQSIVSEVGADVRKVFTCTVQFASWQPKCNSYICISIVLNDSNS